MLSVRLWMKVSWVGAGELGLLLLLFRRDRKSLGRLRFFLSDFLRVSSSSNSGSAGVTGALSPPIVSRRDAYLQSAIEDASVRGFHTGR